MFSFLKKPTKNNYQTLSLKLSGMHCTSCAVNIDLSLEDETGIISSKTNYPKSETTIEFDSTKTTPEKIKKFIIFLGYSIGK